MTGVGGRLKDSERSPALMGKLFKSLMGHSEEKPLIVGCHHKTGTNFLYKFDLSFGTKLWNPTEVVCGRCEERKQPLSSVLKRYQNGFRCYFNMWFEHEIDVPASSIRFLHFVRHPAKWVRSAYLYHKRPVSDAIRWMDWPIFRREGRPVGYFELLNQLSAEEGLILEAIRSYPEILGTARAAHTSAQLTTRHRVSLEDFQNDFASSMSMLCQFVGLDPGNDKVADALREHDLAAISLTDRPWNITRYSGDAEYLEASLMEDPAFRKLYDEPARQMGFQLDHALLRSRSILDDDLLTRILDAKVHLLTDQGLRAADQCLRSESLANGWLMYALQTFGGGHLMMYEFIQAFVSQLEGTSSGRDHGSVDVLVSMSR